MDSTPQADGSDPVGAAYRFFKSPLVTADDPDDPADIARIEDAVISGLALVSVAARTGARWLKTAQMLHHCAPE